MDKVVVIGSTGVIGQAISQEYESAGYEVIRTSSSKKEGFWHLNLRDRSSIFEFSNKVGSVKQIVVAAGKEPQQSLKELQETHLEEMFDLHYAGPLWLIKCLQDKLTNESCITLISSVAANKGSYDPVYASMKGAINSLVRTLARELAPHTRVNAVAPGLVMDTPVYGRMSQEFRDRHLSNTLTNRLLTAKEIAETILFLNRQQSINGQILHINGGQYYGQ